MHVVEDDVETVAPFGRNFKATNREDQIRSDVLEGHLVFVDDRQSSVWARRTKAHPSTFAVTVEVGDDNEWPKGDWEGVDHGLFNDFREREAAGIRIE